MVVFDIETDGLNYSKIYCLHAAILDPLTFDVINEVSLTDYSEMRNLLQSQDILIGHNIIDFDLPVLKKLTGLNFKGQIWDTLAVSYYLYPDNKEHSLESYGERYNVPKIKIEDWKNLTMEQYIERCKRDVKINTLLFKDQQSYLSDIYENKYDGIINYLAFKMDCVREQKEARIKLDVQKATNNLRELENLLKPKYEALAKAMPTVKKYKIVSRPKKMYKKSKDGSLELSALGKKHVKLLRSMNLPDYYLGAVKVLDEEKEPNPASVTQIKDWLFSLGWKPETFKMVKNKNGEIKKVPQIKNSEGDDLCPSVKELIEKAPEVGLLRDISIISHRIGILKGFLESKDSEDFIQSTMGGFTNTLRLKHRKPFVNLPGNGKMYWEYCRNVLVTRSEDTILCGSDMSSLEDSTKQHYMYFFDPQRVQEMRSKDFEPHLDIGLKANMLTKEQVDFYKKFKDSKEAKEDKDLNKKILEIAAIRKKAKIVNFSGVYGAGPAKIAETAKITLDEAKLFHTIYWKVNKAVKQVSESLTVKEVRGQKWLYNPISKFWYYLRAEKDRFSTLNQSSGVYCFDSWIYFIRKQGVVIIFQYHDEIALDILKKDRLKVKKILEDAIEKTNQKLKLNITLGISIDFGNDYSLVH